MTFWRLAEREGPWLVPVPFCIEPCSSACMPMHSNRLVAPPGVDGFETGLPRPRSRLPRGSLVVVGPFAVAAVSWVAFLGGSVPSTSDLQRDRAKSQRASVAAFD